MNAIVSASSRVLSVLSTPPVIGTPKCSSTISGVFAAITATVSPLPMPALDERRREPAASRIRFRPGVAAIAVDDRRTVRVRVRGARDQRQRRQRRVVRGVAIEVAIVGAGVGAWESRRGVSAAWRTHHDTAARLPLLARAGISYAARPPLRCIARIRSHAHSMGHRLSRIVTKTGDAGTTGLGDGSRVAQGRARESLRSATSTSSIRRSACCSPRIVPPRSANCLTAVQHDLFDLGGELSIPGHAAVTDAHVERLEAAVETFNAELPPLKEFILPGGTRGCRACARRAHRMPARRALARPSRRERLPSANPAAATSTASRICCSCSHAY